MPLPPTSGLHPKSYQRATTAPDAATNQNCHCTSQQWPHAETKVFASRAKKMPQWTLTPAQTLQTMPMVTLQHD